MKLTLSAVALITLTVVAQSQAPPRVPDGFIFAAAGDLIGPYTPIEVEGDPNLRAIAAIFRKADLGFANQEGAIFDLATFTGSAAAENGGGTPVSPLKVADNLKLMGITVVSKANNHATDWGTEGLKATLATLAAANIAQAGSGLSLAEARAPGYVQTRLGTAALVDTASTFPTIAAAGAPFTYRGVQSIPRPGLSPLHVRLIRLVSPDDFAALRRAAGNSAYPVKDHKDEIRIGDDLFRPSPTTGLTWEMEPTDEAAILTSIHEARTKAKFVLFSIHAHQTAGDADDGPADFQPIGLHFANEAAAANDPRPADFEPTLFHQVIDAGADAIVRTGPHMLAGIEIYRGKPIFYSLGSLFFPFGTRRTFTTAAGETLVMPDEYFETVIPVSTYKDGAVDEIRLYPVTIETGAGPDLGLPHMANSEQAQKILQRLQILSAPFGTKISIRDGIGIIATSTN
jgi:poly-gamma-glutamate capsule biosynthesis protein CapA/YwtB (metallophosphatase superfamily)